MRRQVLLLIVVALAAVASCDRSRLTPDGPAYRLDIDPPTHCVTDTPCGIFVHLTALAPYKLNRDYPFRYTSSPTPNVTHDASSFTIDDPHSGTLLVTFRATTPGPAHISGSLKLSVCSADECQIESVAIAVDVPVT